MGSEMCIRDSNKGAAINHSRRFNYSSRGTFLSSIHQMVAVPLGSYDCFNDIGAKMPGRDATLGDGSLPIMELRVFNTADYVKLR